MSPNLLPPASKRIISGFTFIIILFVLVGVMSLYEITTLGKLTSTIYKHPLEVSNAALRASMSAVKMHRSMKDVVLEDELLAIEEALNMVYEEEKIVLHNLDIIKDKILGAEGKALERDTRIIFTDWHPIRSEVVALVHRGEKSQAAAITKGRGADHALLIEQKMLALTAYARNKADSFVAEAGQLQKRVYFSTFFMVFAGAIISLLVAIVVVRQMITSFALKKEAEEKKRESFDNLKKFAYSVSHDLKNPAIVVQRSSEIIYDKYGDVLGEKGKMYCELIVKSARLMQDLVNKINEYISTKEITLHIEKIQMPEAIQRVKEQFLDQLGENHVQWLESIDVSEIRADKLSLLRAYINLVDNCFKYGGDTLGEILVGIKESGEYYILFVTDNGHGITDQDCKNIFTLFKRGDTAAQAEGSGVGLAVVQEIAKLHRGKAWVESESGIGTTFYVSIAKNLN